ncbi:MAG: ABC transporter permease [Acidobacteria bacterium]|nr:ABC transporter permease [Acidobacteriota bacterium]
MPEWPRHIRARLSGLRLSAPRESEIVDELSQHLDDQYRELLAGGASADEAERQALTEFQNGRLLEARLAALRQAHTPPPLVPGAPPTQILADLWQDARIAVRSFLRAPRFTIPALLALALGLGVTSAVFSVVQGVLLKPLPYKDPDRLVSIWERRVDRPAQVRNVISGANFIAWRERATSFERIGMVGPSRQAIVLGDQPQEVEGLYATADALAALGTEPQMGRLYTPAEDPAGAERVMVITHEFWQNRLGGRGDVLGLALTVNQQPRTIIGVMPPQFTVEGVAANYLMPYGATDEQLRQARGRGSSHGIARLRDGVSFDQAFGEMRGLMAQLELEQPQRNTNWSITLVPIHEQTVDQIRPALQVLTGAVLLVLLIACVNVANLLLARSTVRQRELGLRAALGAGRRRLLRQLLTESVLLGLAGGAAGLLLAVVFHRGLLALVANRIPVPRLDQVALDGTVMWFTLALAIGTGLVFGVVPAFFATGQNHDVIRDGGRHGSGPRARRVLNALVIAEVALSLVLLVGAGLLIRSLVALQNVDPGMRTEGVLTARVTAAGRIYDTPQKMGAFYSDVLSRIRALPSVQSASAVSFLPMAGLGIGTSFHRLDRPAPEPGQFPGTDVKPVAPDFFRTMGIRQVAGRDFTDADAHDSPQVAIVSEALVRQQYRGEEPLGKRLNVSIGAAAGGMDVEIVGVVADIAMVRLDDEIRPAVYIPHTQLAIGLMTLVARTTLQPTALTSSVAAAVREVDPALPLADVASMDDVVAKTLARPRAVSMLLAAFAVIALVLAGVGVYGVMAYVVSQRTKEIGVRMALGATGASVFRMMFTDALRLVVIGIVVGVFAAGWLSRFLTTMLFGVNRFDVVTFVVTAIVLALVASIASFVPARRSTRIAPVQVLRAE